MFVFLALTSVSAAQAPPCCPEGRSGCDPRLAGYRGFHHSELDNRTCVPATYPPQAVELGAARCVVEVCMDPAGVPVGTRVTNCPEALATAAEAAVRQWRWEPPPIGDWPYAATVVGVALVPGAEPEPCSRPRVGNRPEPELPPPWKRMGGVL